MIQISLMKTSVLPIPKGQLISKYPFGFIVWTKLPTKLFLNFCPDFFYLPGGFLEAFWGFLQASLFMILYTKSPGSPKSFHEAPRKLQKNSGQKSRNNFVGIFVQTMKPKGHFEINWPLLKFKFSQILLGDRNATSLCSKNISTLLKLLDEPSYICNSLSLVSKKAPDL